jgi:hypothetical protein
VLFHLYGVSYCYWICVWIKRNHIWRWLRGKILMPNIIFNFLTTLILLLFLESGCPSRLWTGERSPRGIEAWLC